MSKKSIKNQVVLLTELIINYYGSLLRIAMGTFVQSVLNISPVKTEDAGSNEGLERKFIANGKVDHSE